MSYLLDDVADYFSAQSGIPIDGKKGRIFVELMPDTSDDIVTFYEAQGLIPNPDIPLNSPAIQAIVRSTDSQRGRALAQQVRDIFHQLQNKKLVSTSNIYVYYCLLRSEPIFLGIDDRQRYEWSLTFNLVTRGS